MVPSRGQRRYIDAPGLGSRKVSRNLNSDAKPVCSARLFELLVKRGRNTEGKNRKGKTGTESNFVLQKLLSVPVFLSPFFPSVFLSPFAQSLVKDSFGLPT